MKFYKFKGIQATLLANFVENYVSDLIYNQYTQDKGTSILST